jgi:hypothetical protein
MHTIHDFLTFSPIQARVFRLCDLYGMAACDTRDPTTDKGFESAGRACLATPRRVDNGALTAPVQINNTHDAPPPPPPNPPPTGITLIAHHHYHMQTAPPKPSEHISTTL